MTAVNDTQSPLAVASNDNKVSTPPAAGSIGASVLPITGTVPAAPAPKKKGKKDAKSFRLVRRWGFDESRLTETEGRTLEALQLYRRAETNAHLMGSLDASELLVASMHEAARGTLLSFCDDSELTAKDARALGRVHKIWRKWAKDATAAAIAQAKKEQAESKAAKKAAQGAQSCR